MDPTTESDSVPPLARIVRGNPDPDEIAALTAVLLALLRRQQCAQKQGYEHSTTTGAGRRPRRPLAGWRAPAEPPSASWRRGPATP